MTKEEYKTLLEGYIDALRFRIIADSLQGLEVKYLIQELEFYIKKISKL